MRPTASERTDDVKGVSSGVPTLVLSPRYSSDSIALWQAALASRWSTTRVRQLGDAAELVGAVDPAEVLIYGETILADAVAAALDLALLEPTYAWLPELPAALRLREIELSTLGAARRLPGPVFVKPVDDKFFPARVYAPVEVDAVVCGVDARAVLPVLRRACMPRASLGAADEPWVRPRAQLVRL